VDWWQISPSHSLVGFRCRRAQKHRRVCAWDAQEIEGMVVVNSLKWVAVAGCYLDKSWW